LKKKAIGSDFNLMQDKHTLHLEDASNATQKGTGYWNREDPQHDDHQQYLEEQEQERLATEQRTRELYDQAVQEAAAAQPPTLTVKTDVPPLTGDPTLSPFIAPAPTNSPAFTEP
jgi:hypothetical protein